MIINIQYSIINIQSFYFSPTVPIRSTFQFQLPMCLLGLLLYFFGFLLFYLSFLALTACLIMDSIITHWIYFILCSLGKAMTGRHFYDDIEQQPDLYLLTVLFRIIYFIPFWTHSIWIFWLNICYFLLSQGMVHFGFQLQSASCWCLNDFLFFNSILEIN